MPVKPSQIDYGALQAALRAAKGSFTPESYTALLGLLRERQAFREASRRRQAKYDRKKRQKPAV